MATELQLDIVTPLKKAFSGPVLQVVLPAWEGEEGVLPNHDDKLALLRGGVCQVFTPEGERRFAIGRGFAEMGGDHVTLLTDSCVENTNIDKSEAQAELARLDAEIASSDYVSEHAKNLLAQREVAQAKAQA